MLYDFAPEPGQIDHSALLSALDAATASLTRFDERLRADPLADGLRQRMDFAETLAITREEGELIHLEDLVLMDAGLESRGPDFALSRALVTLKGRRRAAEGTPAWCLSDEGLARITGTLSEPGADWSDAQSRMLAPDEDAFPRLKAWRDGLRSVDNLPPLLAAALAFDHWAATPPLPQNAAMGSVLVAAYLRRRGLVLHHLPLLTVGIRSARFRPLTQRRLTERLSGFLAAAGASANFGMRELIRLSNAKAIMLQRLKGRPRVSRQLLALIDLLLARPVVTIPMAAKALRVSQQAVGSMIPRLGATVREVTGRARYRAWGFFDQQ